MNEPHWQSHDVATAAAALAKQTRQHWPRGTSLLCWSHPLHFTLETQKGKEELNSRRKTHLQQGVSESRGKFGGQ